MVPFLDRSKLVSYTVETVERNLTEGMILVAIILFLFLGNVRGAIVVTLTIPFALMFASICLDLSRIPANLLSLGALDFGMLVDGSVVMIENMVRHLAERDDTRTPAQKIRDAAHEVLRPVFFARGIIITSYLPIFTLQAVEGRLFKPMAWTVTFALLGALGFAIMVAPVMAAFLFRNGAKEWQNPIMHWLIVRYRVAVRAAIEHRYTTVGIAAILFGIAVYLTVGGPIGSEFLPASGPRAHARQQQHIRSRHAAVQNVAGNHHRHPGERVGGNSGDSRPQVRQNRAQVEQRLRGMLVHAVARIDHRQARGLFEQPRRARRVMAQDDGFGAQRAQRQSRILQRFALLDARAQVRHQSGVGAQRLRGQLKTGARAR